MSGFSTRKRLLKAKLGILSTRSIMSRFYARLRAPAMDRALFVQVKNLPGVRGRLSLRGVNLARHEVGRARRPVQSTGEKPVPLSALLVILSTTPPPKLPQIFEIIPITLPRDFSSPDYVAPSRMVRASKRAARQFAKYPRCRCHSGRVVAILLLLESGLLPLPDRDTCGHLISRVVLKRAARVPFGRRVPCCRPASTCARPRTAS